jgi:protein required for attachment to host cells
VNKKLKIASDGWVVVCDARKALIMRNHGDEIYPNLQVEQVLEAPPNPPTREQGTDKPPRTIYAGRRSPIEQTDWHRLAEQEFAKEIAKALDHAHFKSLILVAPARTLADLRTALSEKTRRAIVSEIDKDLTHHPVYEIERHLTGVIVAPRRGGLPFGVDPGQCSRPVEALASAANLKRRLSWRPL